MHPAGGSITKLFGKPDFLSNNARLTARSILRLVVPNGPPGVVWCRLIGADWKWPTKGQTGALERGRIYRFAGVGALGVMVVAIAAVLA